MKSSSRKAIIKKKRGNKWSRHCFLSWKKTVKRFMQCHVFAQSPPDGAPMINIQSTLRKAPDSYTNVSLAVLLCNNANSCPISILSDMYIYTHTDTRSSQYRDVGWVMKYKFGATANASCKGNVYMNDILDTRAIGSVALV